MFHLITYFLAPLFYIFNRQDETMDRSSGSEDDVILSSLKKGSSNKVHLKKQKRQVDAELLRSTLDDVVTPILNLEVLKSQLDAELLRSTIDDGVTPIPNIEVPNTSINSVMSSPDSASGCKRTDGDIPDEAALSVVYGDVNRKKSHIESGSSYSDRSSDESSNSKDDDEIKASTHKIIKEKAKAKAKEKRLNLRLKATKLREKQMLE